MSAKVIEIYTFVFGILSNIIIEKKKIMGILEPIIALEAVFIDI